MGANNTDLSLEDESTKEYQNKVRSAGKTLVEAANSIEEASMFLMQLGIKPDPKRKGWDRNRTARRKNREKKKHEPSA